MLTKNKHFCHMLAIQNVYSVPVPFSIDALLHTIRYLQTAFPRDARGLKTRILKYRILAGPAPCLQLGFACWNHARIIETCMFHTVAGEKVFITGTIGPEPSHKQLE